MRRLLLGIALAVLMLHCKKEPAPAPTAPAPAPAPAPIPAPSPAALAKPPTAAAPASARKPEASGLRPPALRDGEVKLLGWSADAAFLAYERTIPFALDEDTKKAEKALGPEGGIVSPQHVAAIVLGVVRDVRTGRETSHFLRRKDLAAPKTPARERAYEAEAQAQRRAFLAAGDAASFGAWRQAHPLRAPVTRRDSPAGDARADIEVLGGEDGACRGAWNAEAFVTDNECDRAFLALHLRRGDAKTLVGRSTLRTGYLAEGEQKITVAWEPNGRFIAWMHHEVEGDIGGPTTIRDTVHITPVQGTAEELGTAAPLAPLPTPRHRRPKVELLLAAGMRDGDRRDWARTQKQLQIAGFEIVRAADAKQQRPKSVVYFASGHDAEAGRAAAVVPGGATVAPLTWKPRRGAILVVALGASARR